MTTRCFCSFIALAHLAENLALKNAMCIFFFTMAQFRSSTEAIEKNNFLSPDRPELYAQISTSSTRCQKTRPQGISD